MDTEKDEFAEERIISDLLNGCGYDAVLPWDVHIHDDEVVVHFSRYDHDATNMLLMPDLLVRLRAAGARHVEWTIWECGTSEDCVSGPSLKILL